MFTFLLVIVGVGVWSFTDTVFKMGSASAAAASLASDDNTRVLSMWGANFAPLAGVLNMSYYLHTAAVPVIRTTNCPDRKYKDLAGGYIACMVAHLVTGVFGYVGFAGYRFRDYYAGDPALGQPPHTTMDENLDNMFAYDSKRPVALKLAWRFGCLPDTRCGATLLRARFASFPLVRSKVRYPAFLSSF